MPADLIPYLSILIATILATLLIAAIAMIGIAIQIGAMIERIDNERGGTDIDITPSAVGKPVIPQPPPSRGH